jgi:hypothetical protein
MAIPCFDAVKCLSLPLVKQGLFYSPTSSNANKYDSTEVRMVVPSVSCKTLREILNYIYLVLGTADEDDPDQEHSSKVAQKQ